jgi:hypothetical protein
MTAPKPDVEWDAHLLWKPPTSQDQWTVVANMQDGDVSLRVPGCSRTTLFHPRRLALAILAACDKVHWEEEEDDDWTNGEG